MRLPRWVLLWSASLGPPVVWSVHLLLAYYLVSITRDNGESWVRIEIGGLTVIAMALIAATTFVAYRLSREQGDAESTVDRFFGSFGIASGVLFFVATLLTAWPVYMISTQAAA